MKNTSRSYRGLEIYSLVYPRRSTLSGRSHCYDDGFDAAVRIEEHGNVTGLMRSRVFKLTAPAAFASAGDARRACALYAERVIDTCLLNQALFDWNTDFS
ncbi:hypothetical protein [Caballeronia sp. LZ035]|uniref:hypothetical protein n=1 Tax=Caballeronia sp. LZ035 TaxID=3038568 RepID=UPI002864C279|nr:hypothetical protein [Caballeronia sp. LZ035]MDR5756341.1 hypothetical protein [Caballeronia sp. LZ035]